ncbi:MULTISPECIES: hypothetical protein [unclassified Snodgrassella]|uniref:hypothetical protein n=1 Tax=unclassified Snodgrassella TaxID=2625236 RepID=UPI001581D989|nr:MULTISPECIES: hypothetical protein [Snodgrassella]MBI0182287.1 hypothetical protein [Snodgrassella sp. W8158]NUF08088.1 hypothetical protein [Snodgrassella sp. ESL0324]
MDSVFSLANCFALAGGFLGSLVVSDHKRYGVLLTLILVVIGMVFAAAITEYLLPPNHPWLFAGAGVFAGMTTTSLLDAFKATAPRLSQKLINSVCSKAERLIGDSEHKKDEGNLK